MFKKDRGNRIRKKRIFFPTTPLEVSRLEAFFEKMSDEGFLVTDAFGAFYFFQEAPPKKRKFYVEYFYKASSIDWGPAPATVEYLEYCRETSWNHAFSHGKMQCFYTEDLNAPSIETEDSLRFRSLSKAALFQEVPMALLGILYGVLFVQQITTAFTHYISFSILSSSMVSFGFLLVVLMFMVDGMIGIYRATTFYLINKKALARGDGLKLSSPEEGERIMKVRLYLKGLLGIPVIWTLMESFIKSTSILYSMGIFAGLIILYFVFVKTRFSTRKTNLLMLVLITYILIMSSTQILMRGTYDEGHLNGNEILSMEELGYPPESGYREEEYINENSGIIASRESYYKGVTWEDYPVPSSNVQGILPFYEVSRFESAIPWVMKKYQELFMEDIIPGEPLEEQYPELIRLGYEGVVAKQFHMHNHQILLRKGHSIYLVSTHEPFSEEKLLLVLEQITSKP